MNYTIQTITYASPTIKLSEHTAKQLGIFDKKKCIISFGKRTDEVWIEIDDSIVKDTILFDQSVVNHLLIDPLLSYEIEFFNQTLLIGPVIGVLVSKREESLKDNLDDYLTYYLFEKENNGCIFVFAEEQINFEKKELTGFIYDLKNKEWRRATFPFPSVIFRRIGINRDIYRKLVQKMGTNIFNSYYFDKRELWLWTKGNDELNKYLPETSEQVNIDTLNEFIAKYESAIIKPIDGSRGKGVYNISVEQNKYQLKDKYGEILSLSTEELTLFLEKQKNSLIQQPIKLKKYQDRVIDYRVIAQKNIQNKWVCNGIIGRFGKINGVASNYQRYGFARIGLEALQLQWDTSVKRAFQIQEQIIDLVIAYANYLDHICGPYIEFGMDIGIDEDGHLWLIEVNKRHDYSIFRSIEARKIYYDIKLQPISYMREYAMQRLTKL